MEAATSTMARLGFPNAASRPMPSTIRCSKKDVAHSAKEALIKSNFREPAARNLFIFSDAPERKSNESALP